jgi:chromosome segregation ATPase
MDAAAMKNTGGRDQRITELEAQLAESNGRIAAYKQDYPMALSRAERAEAELALAKSIALDSESEARIANEWLSAMSQACDEAHDQFQRAEAENAALREDAERYRWLRYRVDSMSLDPPLTVAKVMGWGLDAWSGDNLSAAIDAARKA